MNTDMIDITIPDWAYIELAGNTLYSYGFSVLIFIISLLSLYLFEKLIVSHLKSFASKTSFTFDDAIISMVESYGWPFYVFGSAYISLIFLTLEGQIQIVFNNLVMIFVVYYVTKSLQSLVHFSFYEVVQKRLVEDKHFDPAILNLFKRVVNAVLWLAAVLVLLQNFGFNVTTLVGGLGIGGIAIAFALQNVLSDVFASISIFFDKPFKSGDFIIVGTDMGVVKKIGIKSTRIATLDGQELVVSNQELTTVRVNNYKRMEKRRVLFHIGVAYQTSAEQLMSLKQAFGEIIMECENTSLDRVHFAKFGDSALIFEIVYYVLTPEYEVYMDTQEKVNFAIKQKVEELEVTIAYPTQTIYIEKQS